MTEREKRIEEMANIAHPIYGANYLDIIALGRLVDADYRKADEVMKETAQKIYNWLKEHTYTTVIYDKLISEFFKQFGVEVE